MEETPFVTSLMDAAVAKPEPVHQQPRSKSNSSGRATNRLAASSSLSALVVTKTSPLVMADLLNCEDIDDDLSQVPKTRPPPPPMPASHNRYQPQQSLIDTGSSKHELFKQVHESMDHLRNELLNKGP